MVKAANSFKQEGKTFMKQLIFLKPAYRLMHPYALKKTYALIPHILSPCSEKDISLYKDITVTTGLVQQPDKIVARFALTIYPYSLYHVFISMLLNQKTHIYLYLVNFFYISSSLLHRRCICSGLP